MATTVLVFAYVGLATLGAYAVGFIAGRWAARP